MFLQCGHKGFYPPSGALLLKCDRILYIQVRKFDLSNSKLTEDDVVIMASDGLWERLSNEKVIKWTAVFTIDDI